MKVDALNINQTVDTEKNQYRVPDQNKDARIAEFAPGYSLDIMGSVTDNLTYEEEGLKSVQDVMAEAGRLDVKQQRNYMAVMSNSMSTEDFAKLQEEGYTPGEVAVEDMVTNLDKIKATLAQSGTVIEGYNDDLSPEEMERITGDANLTKEISSALTQKNLPVTEDNVKNMTEALAEAEAITEVTDGMLNFMVKNHVEPTVENLYKAEYSAGEDTNRRSGSYYRDTANGYYAQKADRIDWDKIAGQVERIVEDAGLSDAPGIEDETRWTIEQGLPLTAENLKELHDIRQITFPIERSELLNTLTDAIMAGRTPQQADLTAPRQISPIRMQRIVEETRLQMSIDANRSLMRQGLVIDTKELERAVEQLKEAEKELFGEAVDVITEIAHQPAESIQTAAFDTTDFTLRDLHTIGQPIQTRYEAAMKTYEAVWTAPRADMGDSIQKAFRNVDDILTDLNVEINEVNRKSVRILGYTETAVTTENFERVRTATEAVLDVIEQMTPEKTLQMIRDGINPLTESIPDLLAYLKQKPAGKRLDSYSEFIWKLDKNHQVTQDEKDAYIGIFRLLRQIEKNDGRPIGDVLQKEEEVTLQNLLGEVRSRKAMGMDVSVDDAFGTLEKLQESDTSISRQITEAFERILQTAKDPEADLAYAQRCRQESLEAAKVTDQVIQTILDARLPVTTDNLLAADHLMHMQGELFKGLFRLSADTKDEKKKDLQKKMESFTEKISEEEIGDAYEEMKEVAEEVLEDATFATKDVIELRELSLLHKQLRVATALSRNDNYEVPMEIGDEMTSVNLRIVRGTQDASVEIRFDSRIYGKVAARFTMQDEAVLGFVSGTETEGVEKLRERQPDFERFAGLDVKSVSYLKVDEIKDGPQKSEPGEKTSEKALYNVAEAFLKSL